MSFIHLIASHHLKVNRVRVNNFRARARKICLFWELLPFPSTICLFAGRVCKCSQQMTNLNSGLAKRKCEPKRTHKFYCNNMNISAAQKLKNNNTSLVLKTDITSSWEKVKYNSRTTYCLRGIRRAVTRLCDHMSLQRVVS